MRKLLFILMMLLSANTLMVSAAEVQKEKIPLTGGDSENYDKNTPRTLICYYEERIF